MSEQESLVLCDVEDGIAKLTLNRPEKMNAWSWRMGAQVNEFLRQCDADDAVRAIIVTGAGRAFCAGADLERGGDTFRPGERRPAAGGGRGGEAPAERPARQDRIHPWEVRKPIIAAINGAAVGVGLTMPLQYDIRIAAEDAKLGFVFTQRGVMPELASTWILPRLIGVSRASELLLSGRILLGEEAARLGLVNEAVPREQVVPRAAEIAGRFRHAAPVSVAITKRMIWEHLGATDPRRAMDREAQAFAQLGRGPDAREGVLAFLQKRPPEWSMKPAKDLPEVDPL